MLIGGIGYGSHYFVFTNQMTISQQYWFEGCLTMVWISYIIAIFKSPGSPPKNFKPVAGEWKRWCKKCQNYKPERSHHCKVCNVCVLQMDHHCPWTMNCVGHDNLPHFLRFLIWVELTSFFCQYYLSIKLMEYWQNRDLPAYLVRKSELIAVCLLSIINFFVLLSIAILLIRCLINSIFRGMTQIEIWEFERIESQFHTERMWLTIRKNYLKLYGKPLPILSSWKPNFELLDTDDELEEQENLTHDKEVEDPDLDPIVPLDFTIDDLIFPYDLGICKNLTTSCGSPWTWILPWGKSNQSGLHFQKNEYMEDDKMGLPWPPDGGHQDIVETNDNNIDDIDLSIPKNISLVRKRLNPRSTMKRQEWRNDLGEQISDFGVDLDAEDIENDELQSIRDESKSR